MMPLHTYEQTVTNPSLLYIIHFTKTGFTLCHSPLYSTKANSVTAAKNNTEQSNTIFRLDMELNVPQMSYQLPYVANRQKYSNDAMCAK
jgi:hypothetical protein